MDISIRNLLQGKPTVIKNKEYLSTSAYVEPFLERLQKVTNDFRVHVQLPDQYTKTVDGDINTDDITYNRVFIEAVMPDEACFNNHKFLINFNIIF